MLATAIEICTISKADIIQFEQNEKQGEVSQNIKCHETTDLKVAENKKCQIWLKIG